MYNCNQNIKNIYNSKSIIVYCNLFLIRWLFSIIRIAIQNVVVNKLFCSTVIKPAAVSHQTYLTLRYFKINGHFQNISVCNSRGCQFFRIEATAKIMRNHKKYLLSSFHLDCRCKLEAMFKKQIKIKAVCAGFGVVGNNGPVTSYKS